jgi:hypothetical protein
MPDGHGWILGPFRVPDRENVLANLPASRGSSSVGVVAFPSSSITMSHGGCSSSSSSMARYEFTFAIIASGNIRLGFRHSFGLCEALGDIGSHMHREATELITVYLVWERCA